MCMTHDHIHFPFVVPKHLRSPGFCSCLRGARVVHVVHVGNLYDVISCNVRYHVRVKFFCRGFIVFIDVICIVLRILVSNVIYIVSVLLSPSLYWCWFVSLQMWNSCLQRGLSTFIYKQKQLPWRWCMQINCRSIYFRLLNISTDSPTTVLIVLYKY